MMKQVAVILLVLSTALANETCCSGSLKTEGSNEDQCDANWSFSCCTDRCYGQFQEDKNFKEADSICKVEFASGIIVSPKTEDENRVIFERRTDISVPLLLGLKRGEDDNKWRWADGTILEWSNWAPNEPSTKLTKRCVVQIAGDNLWKADYCIKPQAYVCQVEPHVHKCPGGECLNDGKCERQWEGWGCTCRDGFYGNKCEETCGGEAGVFDVLVHKVKIEKPANLTGNHFVCEWKIKPSKWLHNDKVQLKFEELNLGESDNCSSAKVSIYEGHDEKEKLLGDYCGSVIPSTAIKGEKGSSLFVKFETDRAEDVDDGFKIVLAPVFGG